jgi:hypothetical protein
VMGALLSMPLVVVVLYAMWLMAEHVLAAGAEWERVQDLLSAWSAPRTAGEAAAGFPGAKPGPSPAVSTLPGCSCPGCELARLLEMDGSQS